MHGRPTRSRRLGETHPRPSSLTPRCCQIVLSQLSSPVTPPSPLSPPYYPRAGLCLFEVRRVFDWKCVNAAYGGHVVIVVLVELRGPGRRDKTVSDQTDYFLWRRDACHHLVVYTCLIKPRHCCSRPPADRPRTELDVSVFMVYTCLIQIPDYSSRPPADRPRTELDDSVFIPREECARDCNPRIGNETLENTSVRVCVCVFGAALPFRSAHYRRSKAPRGVVVIATRTHPECPPNPCQPTMQE